MTVFDQSASRAFCTIWADITTNDLDKTKFFLWENAFESLIDSAPVTARQKLHLLYQYLDGKAKRVVEQFQYLVQDPESADQGARKILKERFGNPAIISTSFEKK